MKISRNWKQMSTHTPTLIKAVMATKGDVCEMGAGFSSTSLLHWICQGRKLITYENDKDYLRFAKKFQTDDHRIRGMKRVDFDHHWSVVLIDHSRRDNNRGSDAIKFKNADLIVLHDTEESTHYGYDKVFPLFKYRYDWKGCYPWTSVVSNVIDVTKWQN